MDKLDQEILELYKELSPSSAYIIGFNEYAGKLFIPSEDNIRDALSRIDRLIKKASTKLQRKVLESMRVALELDEPQPVLDDIINTIFAHLAKEGLVEEHILSLISYSEEAIKAARKRFENKQIPIAVKVLSLYRLSGLIEILDSLQRESKSESVIDSCERLKEEARKFARLFELDHFGEGKFEEVESIFKEYGFNLGRENFYQKALREGFDYHESPEELETKAMKWISEELPKLNRVVKELSRYYGCRPTIEEVSKAIDSRVQFRTDELVKVTRKIRRVVMKFVSENIAKINPRYNTRVIETPSYLTGMIPTGAAQFFDTFTRRPFQVFFQTTDPRRDPDRSLSSILDLLVHEEYGHCVHHSNSVFRYHSNGLSPLQLIPTLLGGPITEGLSFNRELEFLNAVKELEKKKVLTKAEKDYVKMAERYGGLKLLNLEVEFQVRRWRIIRFLRVIGDVRINTGKQGLLEFIDWAHDYTGVSRSNIYFQIFPAHEGIFPGYATCYAVVGQEILNIERKIREKRARVNFSTYLCSIGFPPRSIYREKISNYAKKLIRR